MKLRPDVDPGSLTVGAMTFGILFGWAVLYLTRHEARECLADLDARLEAVERLNDDELTKAIVERRDTTSRTRKDSATTTS